MVDQKELERLYCEAQAALKTKEYDRAAGLLTQILVIDEDYKDVSRLLAQSVRLKRRRWYNDPRVWGTVGIIVLTFASALAAPKIKSFYAAQMPAPTLIPITPNQPAIIPPETVTEAVVTPSPFAWKRLSLGLELKRDTITAIVVDPRDQDVIYVGTDHSGIYKTIDGARSWFPSHDGLERTQVKEIAIDPQDPNILVVHTFPDQIYRSTNGGKTWNLALGDLEKYETQDSYMELFSRRLTVDSQNDRHLLLSDLNGWHESNDGGETWKYQDKKWDGCPGRLGAVGFDPVESTTLLLSQLGVDGDCKNGIYRWDINGNSNPISVLTLEDREAGIIFDIQSKDTTRINYVSARAGSHPAVYSSSDGGLTWRGNMDRVPSCPVFTLRPDGQGLGFCFWNTIGPKGGIMTTYGGENWHTIYNPPTDTITALSFFTDQPKSILAGGYGFFKTVDNGAIWLDMSNGLPGFQVDLHYSLPDDSFYLVERTPCSAWGHLYDSSLYHSVNGGHTWNLATDQGCGLAIDADGNTLYRTKLSSIFLSRDSGISWGMGARISGGIYGPVISIAAHPEHHGIAIAGTKSESFNSVFFSTSDRGFFWQKSGEVSGSNRREDSIYYAPHQDEILYTVGANSNVARSNDGGQSWVNCASVDSISPNSTSILAIHPNDPDKIYLATLGIGIQYSADGCQSWQSMNEGLESLFVNTIAIDPNDSNKVYAGTDGGAYVSFDSGKSWTQINDGLLGAVVVYSIVVDKDSNVY
ncbi:MAG: YCF48-related protein, partial [Anaerolineales bacterium]|nr:YCF48-related protein [Anaerolineales bacterium]